MDTPYNDLSGVYAGDPDFPGSPMTNPHGSAGVYCGVAAGIHEGKDNFLFLDGHVEVLDRLKAADRQRMNKTWWRPLPLDASHGHYAWNSPVDYHVAFWYDTNGAQAGHLWTDGQTINWWPNPPPPDYDWNH